MTATTTLMDVVTPAEDLIRAVEGTCGVADWDALFVLLTPAASTAERQEFLDYARRQSFHPLAGLKLAEELMKRHFPEFDLFSKLVPALIAAVRDVPRLFPDDSRRIALLCKQTSGVVTLSRDQVFGLLALSFFGRLPNGSGPTFGKASWMDLMGRSNPVGVHRLVCFLCYLHQHLFDAVASPDSALAADAPKDYPVGSCRALLAALPTANAPHSGVTFERAAMDPQSGAIPDLEASRELLLQHASDVTISAAVRIEDFSSADAVVDFANKFVHIGCIIPSATQEEVLFSIYPEAMLAVVLFEELDDNEVGCVHGLRRYSDYTGYGPRFQFAGPHTHATSEAPRLHSMVIMDAVENGQTEQFTHFGFHRDMYKALGGFECVRKSLATRDLPPVVATGGWGCGVFGGDQTLKFLQQLGAAAVCGVRLTYSTFGNSERQKLFEAIAFRVASRGITVQDLCLWAREFHQIAEDEEKDFELFVLEKLK